MNNDLNTAVVAGNTPEAAAVAVMLARLGVSVTVLTGNAARGRTAVALSSEAQWVLASIGALEPIEQRGGWRGQPAVSDGAGRLLRPMIPGADDNELLIQTAALLDVLAEIVAGEPGITVLDGELLGASSEGHVWFACGDEVHERRVDLVVGAEGQDSTVRDTGDFRASVRRTTRFYVSGVTRIDAVAGSGELWTSTGAFGYLPVGGGATYFYADVTSDAAADAAAAAVQGGDRDPLLDLWRTAAPAASHVIEAIDDDTTLRLTERTIVEARRYNNGRLVLIGEAAHSNGSLDDLGHALVDAATLVRELTTKPDVETALESYDATRRPAMRAARRLADRHVTWSGLRSPLVRAVRDSILRVTR